MTPVQSGMFPQSQMDRTQFAVPSQMPISREIVDSDFDTKIDPYTGDMPRFDGGGHVGIKSVAKNLAKYGRGGDSIVAHINPQEAAMLKAMGGSGTINPHTGLPEYLGGWVGKQLGNVWEGAKSVVPGVKEIDKGLVGLDKTIGKAIPGGWGTVASIAGSAMGLPTYAMVGLGALSGSGLGHPGRKFNLQGAIMGGAMAYGMANLGEAVRAAAGPSADIAAANASSDPISSLNASQNWTGPSTANAANAVNPDVNAGLAGTQGSITPPTPSTAPSPTPSFGEGIKSFAQDRLTDLQATGRGLTNLSGFGEGTASSALDAAKASPASFQNTAVPIGVGLMSASAADQMADYEKQSAAQNQQANSDYALQMAAIQDAQDRAYKSMRAHPFQYAQGGEVQKYGFGGSIIDKLKTQIESDPSFLNKIQSSPAPSTPSPKGFLSALTPEITTKIGASVPMTDDQRAYAAMRAHPFQYAQGGDVSRFLSGGGDGLSDSIKATINDKQPARLADGEFVVSADVVSGLGGGSSKAGAKKLYAMMDRVRKQAHGTKKQIRPVGIKALPA